jgi:hypothetical protein
MNDIFYNHTNNVVRIDISDAEACTTRTKMVIRNTTGIQPTRLTVIGENSSSGSFNILTKEAYDSIRLVIHAESSRNSAIKNELSARLLATSNLNDFIGRILHKRISFAAAVEAIEKIVRLQAVILNQLGLELR